MKKALTSIVLRILTSALSVAIGLGSPAASAAEPSHAFQVFEGFNKTGWYHDAWATNNGHTTLLCFGPKQLGPGVAWNPLTNERMPVRSCFKPDASTWRSVGGAAGLSGGSSETEVFGDSRIVLSNPGGKCDLNYTDPYELISPAGPQAFFVIQKLPVKQTFSTGENCGFSAVLTEAYTSDNIILVIPLDDTQALLYVGTTYLKITRPLPTDKIIVASNLVYIIPAGIVDSELAHSRTIPQRYSAILRLISPMNSKMQIKAEVVDVSKAPGLRAAHPISRSYHAPLPSHY